MHSNFMKQSEHIQTTYWELSLGCANSKTMPRNSGERASWPDMTLKILSPEKTRPKALGCCLVLLTNKMRFGTANSANKIIFFHQKGPLLSLSYFSIFVFLSFNILIFFTVAVVTQSIVCVFCLRASWLNFYRGLTVQKSQVLHTPCV